MYRHFATLTVAITALVAFFANGENQKALAAASASAVRAKPQAARLKEPVETEAAADAGSWGSDSDERFGKPMISSSSVGAWLSRPPSIEPNRRAAVDEDQALLESEDGGETSAEPAPTASQIAAAAAASRLRSGARGND